MAFPSLGFPPPPAKKVVPAIAFRQVRAGDEVWLGENGYCYPFMQGDTGGAYSVTAGDAAIADAGVVPFLRGNYQVSLLANGSTDVYFVQSDPDSGQGTSVGGNYDTGSGNVDTATASRSSTTLAYGWAEVDSSKFFPITYGNATLGVGIAHGLGATNRGAIAMRSAGDLVCFAAIGGTNLPKFRVNTTAGVQVIAVTQIDATAVDTKSMGIVILPDDAMAFFWTKSGAGLMLAIYAPDGTQRVAATALGNSQNVPSGTAEQTTSVNSPLGIGGTVSDGSLFFASTTTAYKLNPYSGAVITSNTGLRVNTSALIVAGMTVFGVPVVIVGTAGQASALVLDPLTLAIRDQIPVWREDAGQTLLSADKLPNGDIVLRSQSRGASGSAGVGLKTVSLTKLKTRYRVLADATASSSTQLEVI